jgi:RNA polymerase sigma-70 factor (ECF subfamily)
MVLPFKKQPPAFVDSEDRRLIEAFLDGDPATVARIQHWLEEGVRGFRSRLTTPWEDVQQELLVAATRQLQGGAFRGESSLRTYLWRIAKYRCLNLLRKERRRRETALDESRIREAAAPRASPIEYLEERQSADALQRLMAAMPEPCRQLWRRILAGRSYREMSEELGLSEGALRVRVSRCRKRALELWSAKEDLSQPPTR